MRNKLYLGVLLGAFYGLFFRALGGLDFVGNLQRDQNEIMLLNSYALVSS